MRLKDRLAIVTGADGGQGRAVVRKFVDEGARVIAVDLRFADDTPLAALPQVSRISADLVTAEGIASVRQTIESIGRCDVLYNNAGIYLSERGDGPVGQCTPEAWAATIAVNLTAAVSMIGAVIPLMEDQRSGVIINVGSLAGVVGTAAVAYTASKTALIGVSRSVALSHAHLGIRCLTLSLGVVDTEMMAPVRGNTESWSALLDSIPLGRAATAEEVAGWAAFLASDEASYANGANFVIDGARGLGF